MPLQLPAMEAGAQPLARARALALSPAAFRRLALANAGMLVLIVATGATVRLTGSGLGCEHWPGCAQHHFEPKSYHSYIEFSNRVIAFFTILVTLATWLLAPRLSVARVPHFLRDAPAGTARRADRALPPQSVVRPLALPALHRRPDPRGDARGRDARAPADHASRLGAACGAARRARRDRAARQRHVCDRLRPAPGQRRRSAALVVPAGGLLARSRDGRLRHLLRLAARLAGAEPGAAGPRGASCCSACSQSRW